MSPWLLNTTYFLPGLSLKVVTLPICKSASTVGLVSGCGSAFGFFGSVLVGVTVGCGLPPACGFTLGGCGFVPGFCGCLACGLGPVVLSSGIGSVGGCLVVSSAFRAFLRDTPLAYAWASALAFSRTSSGRRMSTATPDRAKTSWMFFSLSTSIISE